ncbi:hypothetical protein [Pseudarthrobacter phenanthrenivorans]|nr:hypothetical protein [Pseudarthrobacter phenanthrenivorans]
MAKQSTDELLEHLEEQRDWLRASAERFDQGVVSESKRMASVVRTLLQSEGALLAQLGVRETMPFEDSVGGDVSNAAFSTGIVGMKGVEGGFEYTASLDPISDTCSFDAWWNNMVFKTTQFGGLRRRDIILKLANKDGGSHVDPTLPQAYRAITRENGMDWVVWTADGEALEHPGNPVPWAMRQIAHEVLATLDKYYPQAP